MDAGVGACPFGLGCREPSLGVACVSALRASILHACALRLPLRISCALFQAGDGRVTDSFRIVASRAQGFGSRL